ncbi:hypothetical protein NUU61_007498 [Penicillium alfredii]|uniref:Uncharacterized protein n=1 Tax=Penicillium alfredii TaxID=1506179 RepID=A0A9W9F2T5_9EURO|nr:uncharacterized protein NUU61_007498 [Penicillium alfredii]KAJ5092628.1 hypothetical protein NUU61_007498 [Penicillium alfredii]
MARTGLHNSPQSNCPVSLQLDETTIVGSSKALCHIGLGSFELLNELLTLPQEWSSHPSPGLHWALLGLAW